MFTTLKNYLEISLYLYLELIEFLIEPKTGQKTEMKK